MLNQAFNYVIGGAKILALHLGKYYKTHTGSKLDAGAFVKAIEYSTGKEAIVVGKPNTIFFQEALCDLKLTQNDVLMIGDDLYNDIYGAQRLNIKGIFRSSAACLTKFVLCTDKRSKNIANLPKG